jgi:hypothetical protein
MGRRSRVAQRRAAMGRVVGKVGHTEIGTGQQVRVDAGGFPKINTWSGV